MEYIPTESQYRSRFKTTLEDRLVALANKMLKEARFHKEIEVAEVTVTEEGFTVEFRFRA
jgi:hypothetical protein